MNIVTNSTQPNPDFSSSLAAVYGLVVQRFSQWAEARLAEIEEELAELAGDPARWQRRLQLRREKRYLRRLLKRGG